VREEEEEESGTYRRPINSYHSQTAIQKSAGNTQSMIKIETSDETNNHFIDEKRIRQNSNLKGKRDESPRKYVGHLTARGGGNTSSKENF
jgi:hypothetical protein